MALLIQRQSEQRAMAEIEYASWLDDLREAREWRCPGGLPHNYDYSKLQAGYAATCKYCGHQSAIPF